MEIISVAIAYINSHGIAASASAYALGLACANIPLIVQKFIELPAVSKWIRNNPDVAEAIVNELKKDVDAVAKSEPVKDSTIAK